MNEAVLRGLRKREAGESLTTVETRAIRAWDKREQARYVDLWLRKCPLVEFRNLAGLTRPQCDRLSLQRGLRLSGAHLDLTALLPSLFEAMLESDDVEAAAGDSPALERLRGYKADMAELELAQKRGRLVDVMEIREKLSAIAAIIRGSGEAMERAGGPAVGAAFSAMIDEVEDAVKRWYTEDGEAANEQEQGA